MKIAIETQRKAKGECRSAKDEDEIRVLKFETAKAVSSASRREVLCLGFLLFSVYFALQTSTFVFAVAKHFLNQL